MITLAFSAKFLPNHTHTTAANNGGALNAQTTLLTVGTRNIVPITLVLIYS